MRKFIDENQINDWKLCVHIESCVSRYILILITYKSFNSKKGVWTMWKTFREMLRVEPLPAVFIIAIMALAVVAYALTKVPGN